MNHFDQYAAGLKAILQAQYNRSGGFTAPTDIGRVRESFCEAFLSEFLPESIGITSGEVIDSFGNQTGQIDVILYDPSLHSYRMSSDVQILLAEGCLAGIEVKSRLDRETFFQSLDKSRQLKSLRLSLRPVLPTRVRLMPRQNRCFCFDQPDHATLLEHEDNVAHFIQPRFYIFAYNAPRQIQTIQTWFTEYVAERKLNGTIQDGLPDMLCALNFGVVYLDNGFAFNLAGEHLSAPSSVEYRFCETPDREVAAFAFHLIEATNVQKRMDRLAAMGLSIHLRKYFEMALEPPLYSREQNLNF